MMLEILRFCAPWLGLLGIWLALAIVAELLDRLLFPGYGLMIVAYAVGAFGVGFIAWVFWKGMR